MWESLIVHGNLYETIGIENNEAGVPVYCRLPLYAIIDRQEDQISEKLLVVRGSPLSLQSMANVLCEICGDYVRTQTGLVRHQATNARCLGMQWDEDQKKAKAKASAVGEASKAPTNTQHAGGKKKGLNAAGWGPPSKKERLIEEVLLQKMTMALPGGEKVVQYKEANAEVKDGSSLPWLPFSRGACDFNLDPNTSSEEGGVGVEGGDSGSEAEEEGEDARGNIHGNTNDVVFRKFQEYALHSTIHRIGLNQVQQSSIKLMHLLLRKKAPLDTYQEVMRWHLQEQGLLKGKEAIGTSSHFITRQALLKYLKDRYHMKHQYAESWKVRLPHSRSMVVMWRKKAEDNVMSLLTDPRWKDEDWLYFDEDPFAAPPEDYPYLDDINSGDAYRETYKELITKKGQILVPILLYIDGAVTGQFDNLQVTALKMSIGILNRKARDREHAWRNLGLVPNYSKEKSCGKRMFVDSGHVGHKERYGRQQEDDILEDGGPEVDKAADYHTILTALLESLKHLFVEGMVVDISYKKKVYKNCELVFFVPFVKCDGDEGDKLCLHYRSRGRNIKQLCRYCKCPNKETDNPLAKYDSYKTVPMLRDLLEDNNAEELKQLSQIGVENAFHGLRFGLHNDRGIHGACPAEMLHAILLGLFMYTRDCFFKQIGKTSKAAEAVNGLACEIGMLLARQSDRDKPCLLYTSRRG